MTIDVEITVQQLLEAYKRGQRRFERIGLVTPDMPQSFPVLRDVDLSGAEFVECDLSSTSFERTNLTNVRFVGCSLKCAGFAECSLRNSWWDECAVESVAITACDTANLQAGLLYAYGATRRGGAEFVEWGEQVAALDRKQRSPNP